MNVCVQYAKIFLCSTKFNVHESIYWSSINNIKFLSPKIPIFSVTQELRRGRNRILSFLGCFIHVSPRISQFGVLY